MGDIYFIVVPVVLVIVALKVCLICCRIWLYAKRREQRDAYIRQRARLECAHPTARVVSVRRVQGPCGVAQQTSYEINQPGCPTRQVTRTIIVRPASQRSNDPNLPPSYDQAITGADHSVKVENEQLGKNPLEQPLPQPPRRAATNSTTSTTSDDQSFLPHMPPPRNTAAGPPPVYEAIPSAPSHNDHSYNDQQRLLS